MKSLGPLSNSCEDLENYVPSDLFVLLKRASHWTTYLFVHLSIVFRFIQFCIDAKSYRGCDFKPATEDDQDLINRLKRVHLDSKEALDAVDLSADVTVTQAEQPAWHRRDDY